MDISLKLKLFLKPVPIDFAKASFAANLFAVITFFIFYIRFAFKISKFENIRLIKRFIF